MGGVECPGDLADDVRNPARRHDLTVGDQRAHVTALEIPHADEQQPIGLAGVIDGHDIRVLNRGRNARFPDESRAERAIGS